LLVIGASAAGASWTAVKYNTPWGVRLTHTSVFDASGNIYVLGGGNGFGSNYNDVWRSTDGGEAPHRRTAAPLRGACGESVRVHSVYSRVLNVADSEANGIVPRVLERLEGMYTHARKQTGTHT
jgi:hypothetical protein